MVSDCLVVTIKIYGINMVESVAYRMPEVDRASTYLPYEMDCEYVMWDCDNVSVDTDWEEEDD